MIDWQAIEEPADRLHGFVSGFHATFFVYTGVECGLFLALREPRTAAELAAECGLHEPYARRFCECGLRWGLLEVDQGTADAASGTHTEFSLDEAFVDALASPGSPQYMGDLFEFLGAHQSEDYQSYPEAFEAGRHRPTERRGSAFTDVIERTTRGLQDIFLESLVPELTAFESRLERGGRLLDAGCGTGRLLCRLCERFPSVDGLGVDLDGDAVEAATDRAERAGLADRTAFRVQDAGTVDGPFTAVVFFMSLHEIARDRRFALFDRLDDVLADDGVIVVFDEVYPGEYDEFDRQPFSAGVETQWAELAWGADVPTMAEHRDLLAAAGCAERTTRTVADRFIVYEGVKE